MCSAIEETREVGVRMGGGISCITDSIVVENIKEDGIVALSYVCL